MKRSLFNKEMPADGELSYVDATSLVHGRMANINVGTLPELQKFLINPGNVIREASRQGTLEALALQATKPLAPSDSFQTLIGDQVASNASAARS